MLPGCLHACSNLRWALWMLLPTTLSSSQLAIPDQVATALCYSAHWLSFSASRHSSQALWIGAAPDMVQDPAAKWSLQSVRSPGNAVIRIFHCILLGFDPNSIVIFPILFCSIFYVMSNHFISIIARMLILDIHEVIVSHCSNQRIGA